MSGEEAAQPVIHHGNTSTFRESPITQSNGEPTCVVLLLTVEELRELGVDPKNGRVRFGVVDGELYIE